MKQISIIVLLSLLASITVAQARNEESFDFKEGYELNLIGKILDGTSNPYHRVDTTVYKGFTEYENNLVRCSAGLAVLFRTNSTAISVKSDYGFIYNSYTTSPLSYMGYDLYIREDGNWKWAGAGASYTRGGTDNVVLVKDMDTEMKECLLYLPMYSELHSCKIGVDKGAALEPMETPFRHRIAVYGSSFTQGVCTSRSGMSYPMQFERYTGMQVVSLATSGNCKMQPQFAAVLEDVEADAYIFDTFSNPGRGEIRERLVGFIDRMVAAHPGKPMIFQQTISYPMGNFDKVTREWIDTKKALVEKIMQEEILGKPQYKDVYFIHPIAESPLYGSSADGLHPDDYGYYIWEKSIESQVLEILAKYGIE